MHSYKNITIKFQLKILAKTKPDVELLLVEVVNGGGVEDIRLEVKAKDTKKIRGHGQGQGQPFRGQTLLRPRTGMLEAKAKDQGHKHKCAPKKRSSQKFFRRSQKKKKSSSQKFFKRSPQKTFSKKIFKRSTKF